MKISLSFPAVSVCLPGLAFATALVFAAGGASAGPIKTYQVTGPVLEVTESTITIEKDKEKWLIARDKDTKVTGDIKTGAKVTVQYRMSATTIEVKGDGKAAEAKADGKADAKADTKASKDKPAKK